MNFNFRYIVNITIIFLLACANPQPPSGGPPDKIAPKIISSYPENKTLNFNDNHIKIEFSEWISRNSVIENLYISPSINYEYNWSGTELELEFQETLDSNTTYVLNLGTEWSDLKNNKPESAFTLIFSTGNYVDSCSIKGTLHGNDVSGAFIYSYKIDDINPDTLNPAFNKPHYKTQVGTSGNFELTALKPGLYRLFAIKDINKDIIYNEGLDPIGTAPKDYKVTGDSIQIINLKLGTPIDKIAPMLFNADCFFNNFISLNFSEPIDTNSIQNSYFILSDSSENKNIKISAVSLNNISPDKIDIIPAENLDTNTLWKIQIIKVNGKTITDTASNQIQDSANFTYFYSEKFSDTTKIKFPKLPFKDSSYSISLNPELRFIFEKPIQFNNNIDNSLTLINSDSSKIDVEIKHLLNRILVVKPSKELTPNNWHFLNLQLGKFCYYNNSCLPDTNLILHFKTLDNKIFGGAKGKIKEFNKNDTNLIVVFNDGKNNYQTTVNDTGYWELKQLPKGNYNIEVFRDLNSNLKYDFGDVFPFKHSEPFIFIETKYTIKPRWTIELILPKPD